MFGSIEIIMGWIIVLVVIAIAVKYLSGEISPKKGKEVGGFFQGIKNGLTGDLEEEDKDKEELKKELEELEEEVKEVNS